MSESSKDLSLSIKTADIQNYLDKIGSLDDGDIDLVQAALSIASQGAPNLSTERYYYHVQKMGVQADKRYKEILKAGGAADAGSQLASLKHILIEKNDYRGNAEEYDNLDNANLVRVIEQRKGLPIALAILYVQVGRLAGFDVSALSFPAHVVCRLDHQGERLIFDPFSDCKLMQAPDLRALLKQLVGQHAELSADFYSPSNNRDMLIRLQNNIKLRQIEGEDYKAAAKTVDVMRKLDPTEYRFSLDSGILSARLGQYHRAIHDLEHYIAKEPSGMRKQEALTILQQIKSNMN